MKYNEKKCLKEVEIEADTILKNGSEKEEKLGFFSRELCDNNQIYRQGLIMNILYRGHKLLCNNRHCITHSKRLDVQELEKRKVLK